MSHNLILQRYRRFAFFLFLCGMLYGTAFYAIFSQYCTLRLVPTVVVRFSSVTWQTVSALLFRLLPLFFFDCLLWFVGATYWCGAFSCLLLFLCGNFYSFFAASLFRMAVPLPFILLIFCLLYLLVWTLISQCWQMNRFSHTLRSCGNITLRKSAFLSYTAHFLRVLPLQILLILSVWFTISHFHT